MLSKVGRSWLHDLCLHHYKPWQGYGGQWMPALGNPDMCQPLLYVLNIHMVPSQRVAQERVV